MNEAEISWAAGFWDGEGCCHVGQAKSCRTRSIRLFIHQSFSPECLIRFENAVEGLGYVRGPYTKQDNPNLYWTWQVAKVNDVHRVMEILMPFLSSPKRQQYEDAAEKRAESIAHLPVIDKPSKEDLERMYWVEEMTQEEIGKAIGVTTQCVGKWMKKLGISSRRVSRVIVPTS